MIREEQEKEYSLYRISMMMVFRPEGSLWSLSILSTWMIARNDSGRERLFKWSRGSNRKNSMELVIFGPCKLYGC